MIELELNITAPIEIELDVKGAIEVRPVTRLVATEADPLFMAWLAGDPRLSNWEVDGANGLKPKDGRTVDGDHISGTIYGGLFQP
jgi:hypothetical protein